MTSDLPIPDEDNLPQAEITAPLPAPEPLDANELASRAMVIVPILPGAGSSSDSRSPEAKLDEAVALAAAIQLNVVSSQVIRVNRPTPGALMGSGTVDALAAQVAELQVGLVIINRALSPVQQRNLERAIKAKVIDRTGLILEIFGARARTREGQLQVELAALTYQRSRLVRSWTHLERQRGGFGFLGGPGESQLEMDRRLIDERIIHIKRDLVDVRRTRGLHRKARAKVPYPVVALVGYTNAGKSTLFNRLSGADVFAKDLLFATLDPTMRAIPLPSGRNIILSDTVGFIADLPTHLVESFRATLEEVENADIILHVRDISHPDTDAQRADVLHILTDLGINADDARIIEVLNKLDLADEATQHRLHNQSQRSTKFCALSAITGEGFDRLTTLLDRRMTEGREVSALDIGFEDGAAMAWLYQHGEIVDREDDETCAHLHVALEPADLARFNSQFRKGED